MQEKGSSNSIVDRPRFIDRVEEMDTLLKGLRSAKKSRGGMVLLEGEAGIGKTRLIEETISKAKEMKFRILSGRCLDYRRTPYLPFIEMLRDYFGISTERLGEDSKENILRSIEMEFGSLERDKEEFLNFFYPKGEIVGGFRTSPDMEKTTVKELQDRGYRIIVMGNLDELKVDSEIKESISIIPIDGTADDGLDPKRIERIAKRIKDIFERSKHSVILFNGIQTISEYNPEAKVSNLISISVDLSRSNNGVVIFSIPEKLSSKFNDLPLKDVNCMDIGREDPSCDDGNVDKDKRGDLIYRLLPTFFKEISVRDPVLVVLEDLQLGDKSTYNLIQFLARDAKKEKIFIIGSYRPSEIAIEGSNEGVTPFRDAIQRMSREHLFTTLSLERFDREKTVKLASAITGSEIDIKDINSLVKSTQGNPFFIIDFIRKNWDLENPILTQKPTEERMGGDLISKRLSSLEERERKILEMSAVLGESITVENLQLILSSGIDEILDVMDILIQRKFLIEMEEGFVFEHPKVQEAVYDQIAPERRKKLHRSIAETFEMNESSDHPEGKIDLSVHHFHAGDSERALDELIQRGDRQIEGSDLDAGLRSMNMAVECLEELGDGKDTLEQWIRVLRMKGDILDRKDEVEKGYKVFKKALTIAVDNDMEDELSTLYRRIGDLLLKKFDWDETIEHYLSSLHVSKKADDDHEISQAFKGLGRIYLLKGEYHRSIECFIKYLEYPDKSKGTDSIQAMIEIGEIYFQMGDFNQALAYYKLAITKGEEGEMKSEISMAYVKIANVLLKLGEVEESKRYAELARETIQLTETSSMGIDNLLQYSDLMLEVGQLDKADEVMAELEGSIDGSSRLIRAFAFRVKGILLSRKRDFRGSISHFKASIDILEELQVPYQLALTYFHFGLIKFQQMDVEGALEMLNKANFLFKEIKSLFYLNRTSSKIREVTFIREGLKS